MELRVHDNVDDFRGVAVDIYRRDPVSATVELTALRGLPPHNDTRAASHVGGFGTRLYRFGCHHF
jgi:hypothetical protein